MLLLGTHPRGILVTPYIVQSGNSLEKANFSPLGITPDALLFHLPLFCSIFKPLLNKTLRHLNYSNSMFQQLVLGEPRSPPSTAAWSVTRQNPVIPWIKSQPPSICRWAPPPNLAPGLGSGISIPGKLTCFLEIPFILWFFIQQQFVLKALQWSNCHW